MKLLVADRLEPLALEELKHLGAELVYEPDIPAEALAAKLEGVGVLVVRSKKVDSFAIDAGRHLHLIVRAGAGTQNIDVAAASARGIYVAHCPGKNAIAVAELTMALIAAIDRRIPDAVAQLRAGRWERADLSRADGLFGRTLGLAGFGAIAREVSLRARAFGMNVVAHGRSLTPQRAAEHGVGHARSLEELASRSQIFSVHLPLSTGTRGVIDKKVFAALPERAIFVNTARAEVVDEEALVEAVEKRRLRVGLDVFADAPHAGSAPYDGRLLGLDGLVYGTPNVGAATAQAQSAVASETVRIIRSFLRLGDVPNCVNICATSPARYQMVIRCLDKVGVLANVLGVVKRHGLNVEELASTIFEGATAACTKLRVTGRPSEACVSEIKAFAEVFHVDVVALPNMA
ncbi:MAG: D-3-phosphoglycerate dehydrogenase [Myxococcales bacterium]|nr:D-3-phosphoglycerate dehydrogenase [Myxococcales bacterium]